MQIIYILLLLNTLLKASLSSDPQTKNDKVVKNKGRLSRVTWLLHENENDNLDRRMFDDDDRTKEKTYNKMHYKKRKYNVKVEHKRRDSIFRNTSKKGASISKRKEIVVPKYVHILNKPKRPASKEDPNDFNTKVKKNQSNKSNKLKKELKTAPKVSKAGERTPFNDSNDIETDSILKDLRKDFKQKNKKIATKENIVMLNEMPRRYGKQDNEKTTKLYVKLKTKSQVHRKPKKVYLKKVANPNILLREEPQSLLHSKMDPNTNIRNIAEKNRENMLKLVGLNFASLANPPKHMQVKVPKVHDEDNTYIADELAKKVRVLCWVMTHPGNHNKTCKPIKDTWGKRCNKLLFISTEYDPEIPTVKLEVREGREYLWPKVKAAFKYVYDNYHDQYDWFLRADDDTFLVVENLRYLLADFDPQEPMYFGCRFKHFSPQHRLEPRNEYMFGGSGVALSRKALQRAVKAIDLKQCEMSIDDEMDDVKLGICLSRIGVKAMDSRDVAHKGRFLVFMPQDHVSPTKLASVKSFWYWKYVFYPTEIGQSCCSDYAISFHYVTPDDMYALDYLIYRIRPFGIRHGAGPVPEILGKVPMQKKTANRKTRTREDEYTVTDSTIASTVYDDNAAYTQKVEKVASTTELNEIPERRITEVVTSQAHSEFYEQSEGPHPAALTENVTSVKVEDLAKRDLKQVSTTAVTVKIASENNADSNTTDTTANSKAEYEEIATDDKEELVVNKKQKKRSSTSKIQRSVKRRYDIKYF